VSLIDRKVYDSIPIAILWKEVGNTDTNSMLIEATMNLYEKNNTRII
jgi:hypothetical protein